MGRSILLLCTALACGEPPVSTSPGATTLGATGRGSDAGAGADAAGGAGGALAIDRALPDGTAGPVAPPEAPSDDVRQGVVFDRLVNPTRHGP